MMKAMVYGCLPLTSKLTNSVLSHLTKPYDISCKALNHSLLLNDNDGKYYSAWIQNEWLPSVIEAATSDHTALRQTRRAMMSDTRQRFSWRNTSQILYNLISR